MSQVEEWWVEEEITPRGKNWDLNDEILLLLHDEFLLTRRHLLESWHFFREPQLRFRVQLRQREARDGIASELDSFLDGVDLAEDHYVASHGRKAQNLDDGYVGERGSYGRLWPLQKKIWEWGSEMAVEAIKELKEQGSNDPPREFQLERVFHLLCNQIRPMSLSELELYQRCVNKRILIRASMQASELDKQLAERLRAQDPPQ